MDSVPRAPQLEQLALEDLASMVDRMILTRWGAAALMVVLTFVTTRLFGIPLPETPLLSLACALFLFNLALAGLGGKAFRRPLRAAPLRHLVVAQVVFDWGAMTAFLHFTGGVTSPAIPLLLIHMLMVTMLLPAPSPYVYVALAFTALTALAAAERVGLLEHHAVLPLPDSVHRDLTFICAQLAFFGIVAFASVHLTRLVVAQLRARDRQVGALLRASQSVSSSLKLEEVLDQLVRAVAWTLGAKAAAIRMVDETGQRMAIIASCGLSERYLNKGFVQMSRSQIDREALGNGAPIIVDDALHDRRIQYPKEVAEEGIASLLVVPVAGRRGPLGVLRIYGARTNAFTSDDVRFALSIASQGALAIENAMTYEALQRMEQARGQFVRTVTHELRSPLSGARSLMRVMLDEGLAGELPKDQRDVLVRVDARLSFLSDLVNDLLALAASQSAELREKPVPVDLLAALGRIVDLQTVEGAAKGVAVSMDAPGEALRVLATDQGLARVFGNLVGNGVKYTPRGGRVEVRVVAHGKSVAVAVSDTGMGIPEDDLPKLWQEFFRAKNAKSSEIVGTGLGLSIVKQLVTSFGGTVGVQSRLGEGTTFTVTLPLVEDRTASDAAAATG